MFDLNAGIICIRSGQQMILLIMIYYIGTDHWEAVKETSIF